jgi:hypothetical protein
MPLTYVPPTSRRTVVSFTSNLLLVETAANVGAIKTYRLNSVYDPDAAVLTQAALGWSEWSQFYLRYRVHSVRWRIEGFVTTTYPNIGRFTVWPNPYNATAPAQPGTWFAQYKAVSVLPAPLNQGGANKVLLSGTWPLWKLLRIDKRRFLTEENYSSQASSNPASMLYMIVGVSGIGASAPVGFTGTIQLAFETEWYEPVPLSL